MPVRPVRFPVVRPVRISVAGRFRNPCLAGLRSEIVAEKESGTPRYRESSALFRHCPPRVNAAPSPSTTYQEKLGTELEQLLRTGRFYDLPDLLIRTANENGGPDNITALLLCVEEVR